MTVGQQRPKVYFDTCIAIYFVEKDPMLFPRISKHFVPDDPESPRVVYSDLVRLECRIVPLRNGDDELLERFEDFFGLPDAIKAPINSQVFDDAADLRARYGLKTPDALHLAAAIAAGCDALWTNDDRLNRAAENHLDITIF